MHYNFYQHHLSSVIPAYLELFDNKSFHSMIYTLTHPLHLKFSAKETMVHQITVNLYQSPELILQSYLDHYARANPNFPQILLTNQQKLHIHHVILTEQWKIFTRFLMPYQRQSDSKLWKLQREYMMLEQLYSRRNQQFLTLSQMFQDIECSLPKLIPMLQAASKGDEGIEQQGDQIQQQESFQRMLEDAAKTAGYQAPSKELIVPSTQPPKHISSNSSQDPVVVISSSTNEPNTELLAPPPYFIGSNYYRTQYESLLREYRQLAASLESLQHLYQQSQLSPTATLLPYYQFLQQENTSLRFFCIQLRQEIQTLQQSIEEISHQAIATIETLQEEQKKLVIKEEERREKRRKERMTGGMSGMSIGDEEEEEDEDAIVIVSSSSLPPTAGAGGRLVSRPPSIAPITLSNTVPDYTEESKQFPPPQQQPSHQQQQTVQQALSPKVSNKPIPAGGLNESYTPNQYAPQSQQSQHNIPEMMMMEDYARQHQSPFGNPRYSLSLSPEAYSSPLHNFLTNPPLFASNNLNMHPNMQQGGTPYSAIPTYPATPFVDAYSQPPSIQQTRMTSEDLMPLRTQPNSSLVPLAESKPNIMNFPTIPGQPTIDEQVQALVHSFQWPYLENAFLQNLYYFYTPVAVPADATGPVHHKHKDHKEHNGMTLNQFLKFIKDFHLLTSSNLPSTSNTTIPSANVSVSGTSNNGLSGLVLNMMEVTPYPPNGNMSTHSMNTPAPPSIHADHLQYGEISMIFTTAGKVETKDSQTLSKPRPPFRVGILTASNTTLPLSTIHPLSGVAGIGGSSGGEAAATQYGGHNTVTAITPTPSTAANNTKDQYATLNQTKTGLTFSSTGTLTNILTSSLTYQQFKHALQLLANRLYGHIVLTTFTSTAKGFDGLMSGHATSKKKKEREQEEQLVLKRVVMENLYTQKLLPFAFLLQDTLIPWPLYHVNTFLTIYQTIPKRFTYTQKKNKSPNRNNSSFVGIAGTSSLVRRSMYQDLSEEELLDEDNDNHITEEERTRKQLEELLEDSFMMCIEIFHYYTIQLSLYSKSSSRTSSPPRKSSSTRMKDNASSQPGGFDMLNKILQPFLKFAAQQQQQRKGKKQTNKKAPTSPKKTSKGTRGGMGSESERDDAPHHQVSDDGQDDRIETIEDLFESLNTMTLEELQQQLPTGSTEDSAGKVKPISLGSLLLEHYTISYKDVLSFGREYGLVPYLASDYIFFRYHISFVDTIFVL